MIPRVFSEGCYRLLSPDVATYRTQQGSKWNRHRKGEQQRRKRITRSPWLKKKLSKSDYGIRSNVWGRKNPPPVLIGKKKVIYLLQDLFTWAQNTTSLRHGPSRVFLPMPRRTFFCGCWGSLKIIVTITTWEMVAGNMYTHAVIHLT